MESNTVNPPPPRRACEECNRKKTKCDMKWPLCGLCQRTGQQCTFPTRRKQHVRRQRSVTRINKASSSTTSNLERLVNLLTSRVESEGTRRQEASRLIEILSSSLPATSCHGQAASQTSPEHLAQVPIVSQSDHQSGEATSIVVEDSRRTPNDGQGALDQQQSTPTLEPGVHSSSSSSSSSSYTPHHLPPHDAANEEIPADLARQLVDTFFARIQPWLPIFHKPRFYKKHLDPGTHQLRNMKELPADEALLFWAMLALSARHCQWDGVDDVLPPNRDVAFASHAIRLQEEAWKGAGNSPSIAHVQGCVLLAFYLYSCGSFCQGWVLVGICVRLVYELDIQNIDRDGGDTTLLLVDDWVSREEKRRLWWLIWELDRFGSSLAERPYAIDNRDTAVMLPVSDKNWFSEIPVASVKLDPRPEMAWKALQGCPNQDSRAWFLVGNYLLCLIDERKHYEPIEDQRLQLDAVMNCFRLVLPREFHLDSGALVFGPDKFAQWNWVIGTQLMVLTARGKLDEMSSGDTNAQAQDKCPNQQSRSYLEELLRILSVWPPECIGYAHPFLACTILGPRSVNIARPIETEDALTTLKNELTRLALSQYATYWKLGSVLLDLCDFVQEARTMPSLNSPVKYLSALVPSSQQARNHYPSPNGQLPVDNFYFLQSSIHASDGSTSSYNLAPDQRAGDAAQPPAALSTIYSSDNISALDTYSGLDTDLTDSFQDCFPDIFG